MGQAAIDLFAQTAPYKPYCADDFSHGSRIRTRQEALKYKHIQHNPPAHIRWVIIDVDRPGAAAWAFDGWLPPAAWVAINDDNGHAHVAYGLKAPVCTTDAARMKPLRYLDHVERGLRAYLDGDPAYSGHITKNPLHPCWRIEYEGEGGIYELDWLDQFVPDVPANESGSDMQQQGIGRNVSLFDALRTWGYRAVREYWQPGGYDAWLEAVLRQAEAFNDFPTPLPYSEVKAAARSTAKWIWKRFSPQELQALIDRTHTPAQQARRGRMKGQKRKDALLPQVQEMAAQGHAQRLIADTLGLSKNTVTKWLKNTAS